MKNETTSTTALKTGTYCVTPLQPCSINPQQNGVHLWDIDLKIGGPNLVYVCKLCGLKVLG